MSLNAFVTGADRGLGLALVQWLAEHGHTVYAGALGSGGDGLASLVEQSSGRVVLVPLDVRSDDSVKAAAATVGAHTPSIDLLINNAGILGDFDKSIHDGLDFEDMKATYDVNCLGPLRVSQAFYPLVARGHLKRIVNISSEAGSIQKTLAEGRSIRYGYCQSKSALNAGSAILQSSAGKDGIRVFLIEPGWIRSYMHGAKNQKAELEPEQSAADILKTVLGELPPDRLYIDRFGQPYAW